MPGVLTDPYSGQPLRLAVIAGKPVIYSVGPDGQDDKAKVEFIYLTRNKPGDVIFQTDKSQPN